jgi:signal transduction histidine kinase
VALQWRIRHKLMMGYCLVVGVIALLLAGTLYGLTAYRSTMKSFFSKLAELHEAESVRNKIKDISSTTEVPGMVTAIQSANKALDEYEDRLNDTVEHGRAVDNGFKEQGLIAALRQDFKNLNQAAQKLGEPRVLPQHASRSLIEDPDVKQGLESATRDVADLIDAIYTAYFNIHKESQNHYQMSLWSVILVSAGGVLLLFSLLRFFYNWVFAPIHTLEVGTGRLAHGDFDHVIEVHSGDELEDLARAFNDMTSRLRDMYRDLARQVNERSRQLVRSERLVSVGFLAAGVAHEINNPLASILFCSEALEQRLTGLLNSAAAMQGDDRQVVAKYLKMIQDESVRCKSITQRLLEFSRGGERSREPTDLATVIQSVLDVVEHLENSRGKKIVFKPDVRVVAWVNAQEIKSVVLNLVVNALDSMEEGGTLRIALGQRDGMAYLEFTDTGCGMTAEILENIFEPFYTRSRTGKGTGLGLSISHRIISSHGGEIEAVSSGPGRGSTFTVRLPLKPAEPAKEEPVAA